MILPPNPDKEMVPTDAAPLLPAAGSNAQQSTPRQVMLSAAALIGGIVLATACSFALANICSAAHPIVFGHAFIAFALGLRHAVDIDHLAAIDNVSRQLILRGQWPVSVGFWFALGHSSVVLILTAALAGGYSWLWSETQLPDGVVDYVSLVAGCVSVSLLGGVGILNAHTALGLFRSWSGLQGRSKLLQDEEAAEAAQESLRSVLSVIPFVKRVFEHVDRPIKMYTVGFLFGLSFDSATQVGVIGLAAISGTKGKVPALMVLIFPLCFSCGMCLVDTANGLLMLITYSWSSVRPVKKLFYNFLVTALSATIALLIGSLELLQIVADRLKLKGTFWTCVRDVDMAVLGYAVICVFAAIFTISIVYTRGCCGLRQRAVEEEEQRESFSQASSPVRAAACGGC